MGGAGRFVKWLNGQVGKDRSIRQMVEWSNGEGPVELSNR